MKKFILSLTFFGSIFISSGLFAQLPSVAIMAAEQDLWIADVQLKLQSTGFFEFVDTYNTTISTPDLLTMQSYDAILVFTDQGLLDATTFGNNLGSYIEGGGGVVAATFYNILGIDILGSFGSLYQLLSTTSQASPSLLDLVINDPKHPTLKGVNSFNGGTSSFRSDASAVINGGTAVASWSNGSPLVVTAENIGPALVRRVDLNFFPVSSDISSNFWDATTDGDIILGNALLWVAGYDRPGTDVVLTAGIGLISDGSNQYDYINNETASWLISPAGAQSITLNFTSFDTESGVDFVTVYNGPDNLSPVLGSFEGTIIPASVTSSGGDMFIEFTTDGSITQSGWAANYTITFDLPTAGQLVGDWVMLPQAGAFYVGPSPGSDEYFSNDAVTVTIRSCFFDDVYKFGTGGDYSIEMDNETWLEGWQGSFPDDCGVPVAPHDGIGPYSYSVSSNSLTLSGFGAFMGLPKSYNGAELPTGSVPSSITYDIVQFDDQSLPKTLSLQIEIGGGVYWTFRFQSDENLTGSYPFDGNAIDVSGLGNDLTEFGPLLTNDRFTNGSSAYSYDGVDDYMSVLTEIIPPSGDFSVSVWAKSTGPNNIFTHLVSQNADAGQNFYIGQGSLGEIRIGDGWSNTGISYPTDGQWHHFVVTKDDLNTTLFLDNVAVASLGSAILNPAPISPEFRVGRQYGGIGEYFEGSIDDIKIFDITLNSTEINNLYIEGGWPTVPAVPVAHWPITAADGGNDITGNGNDLDDESSGLGASGTDRFKVSSETFEFSGTNYAVARSTNHPTGNFTATYSFWEYHTIDHIGKFISVGSNSSIDASAVRIFSGLYEYQNGQDVAAFSPVAPLNRWNHVVLIREGDNVTLWLNGQQYETITMISQGLASTDIYVGQTGDGGEFFQGEMDDIRIYNYAISASEVQTLFDEGVDTSIPLVRLDPSLVTADDGVRLIYNAERGNKALMGLDDDDVYIFSGVLTSDVTTYYQPWEFLTPSNFFDNSVGLMTPVSGTVNQWEINLGPSIRNYYSVPAGTPIYQLGMVFRDSNGDRVGTGNPDFGAFTGGFVTDGSNGTTPGDIYVEVANASTELELDELALIALYNSTNGDFWTDNTNWLTGSIDTWFGVTVSGGRVVDVYLDENNLTGTLPSAIGQLDASTSFSITGNNVSGDIPAAIGNMASLEYLYLDANALTGDIPSEIGNLNNLMELYLNDNSLSGIIPSSLGNLTNLQYLSLYLNQLSGSLPSSLSNLTNLFVLDIGDNNINGLIPTYLGSLTNLSEIWLGNNSFAGSIPSELGNLPNLTQLYLYSNDLSGSIPLELGNLTNLIGLDLYENNLSGYIPEELGNLSNLIAISLNDNNLTGGLPNGFGSMISLVYLDIGYNQLQDIPNLGGTALTDLYIGSNKFTMEDILLNLGVPSITYDYNPQELVGDPQNRIISNGTNYTFDLGFDSGVGGSVYSWYQDEILYTTTFVPSLDFSPISFSDAGNWFVEITNSSLPGLILRTEDIYLNVENICISTALNSADTRIERVVFNDLDNSSPDECSTYTNYTNLSATVYPGQNVEVGFVLGTCGVQATRTLVVLVDWDQSGDFQLANERVVFLDIPDFNNAYFNAFIDIPTDVVVDENYLIRVVTIQDESDYLNITGCESYSFGETEDYTLNVVDGAPDLAIQLVDAKPNTMFQPLIGVNAGTDIQVTTNVTNTGLANVDLTRGIGYYLSMDASISGDDLELGTIPITNLTTGNIFTDEDVIVNIPSSTAQGQYYLIAVADPDQVIGDPDLSDNYSVSSQVLYVIEALDSEDPVVTLISPPSSYTIGTGGISISASVSDNLDISGVVLAYGKISEITDDFDQSQYNVIFPEESTAGIYEHFLSDSDFDDVGVQYYFGATDGSGNVGFSSPLPAKVSTEFIEGSINLSSVSPVSNSESPQETDYRIFSVPVRSATVSSVLGGNPPSDKSQWRVWQYNGNNTELNLSSSLSAGNGYWLIYQNSVGLSLTVGGVAVDASNSNPFTINLSSGINLIGNPFRFTISWQEVLDHNIAQGIINPADVSGLTFYQGGFNSAGNADLQVTEGAFVQSNEAFTIEIPISSNAFARTGNNARTSRNSLDEDNWEVGINLANEATFYNVAAIGMNTEAEEGKDRFDQMAMPFLFRYLEFNSANEEFINERISKDVVKTIENYVWEFEASTSFDPSEASLSWDNSYFGDNDQQLYLYDLKEERIINMREQTEYHFFLRDNQNFKILYGSPEFIESTLKPGNFTLGHAYPNPFADLIRIPFSLSAENDLYKVRLMVYNSIGELINVLVEDDYQSGFYVVDWDGTNEFGQQVSEGIYIYKLRITHKNGSDELTGKLIYRN